MYVFLLPLCESFHLHAQLRYHQISNLRPGILPISKLSNISQRHDFSFKEGVNHKPLGHSQVLVEEIQQNLIPALILRLNPLILQVTSANPISTHSLTLPTITGKKAALTLQTSTHAPDHQKSQCGSSPSAPHQTSSQPRGSRPWTPACRGGL